MMDEENVRPKKKMFLRMKKKSNEVEAKDGDNPSKDNDPHAEEEDDKESDLETPEAEAVKQADGDTPAGRQPVKDVLPGAQEKGPGADGGAPPAAKPIEQAPEEPKAQNVQPAADQNDQVKVNEAEAANREASKTGDELSKALTKVENEADKALADQQSQQPAA